MELLRARKCVLRAFALRPLPKAISTGVKAFPPNLPGQLLHARSSRQLCKIPPSRCDRIPSEAIASNAGQKNSCNLPGN